MSWLSTVASIGMAVGPPLVYADQTTSIIRKKRVSALVEVLMCLLKEFHLRQRFDRIFS